MTATDAIFESTRLEQMTGILKGDIGLDMRSTRDQATTMMALLRMPILGPGPSGLTRLIAQGPDREAAIIAHRQNELKTNMQATVDGMKALAEADRES